MEPQEPSAGIASGVGLRRTLLTVLRVLRYSVLFILGWLSPAVPIGTVHYVLQEPGIVPRVGVQPTWFAWVDEGVAVCVFLLAWFLVFYAVRAYKWRNWRVALPAGMATSMTIGVPGMVTFVSWQIRVLAQ
jgi:hypothetical protein